MISQGFRVSSVNVARDLPQMIFYSPVNWWSGREKGASRLIAWVVVAGLLGGCSIKRMAVNAIADSLSEGPSTFETDNDIELIGEALPFALKLFEVLLDESPRHPSLLLTTCKGFTVYTYAYVHQEADREADMDFARGDFLRARARRLYERAQGYGRRALDLAAPGTLEGGIKNEAALARLRARDVPVLYWNAAALGLAISVSRDDPEMLARIPEVRTLIKRAMELDEEWDGGSLLEFELVLAGTELVLSAGEAERLTGIYERVSKLSGTERAGPHVSYAEAVAVRTQNRQLFTEVLGRALAVDPDRDPNTRMVNLIHQRRARWLLERVDELFLDSGEGGE